LFSRKEIISSTLAELEPVRNDIAHNRVVHRATVGLVQAAHDKIAAAIGVGRFSELVNRCTTAPDLVERIGALKAEADDFLVCARSCGICPELACWSEAKNSWWFDPDYLGQSIEAIVTFYRAADEYGCLPRIRARGTSSKGGSERLMSRASTWRQLLNLRPY